VQSIVIFLIFTAHQHYMQSALLAIVEMSVCSSVTGWHCVKCSDHGVFTLHWPHDSNFPVLI